jgi:hypothetical protein
LSVSGTAVISDNSANAALRITQVGAGNALLVEDSANPDATPFVINNSGAALVGVDATRTLFTAYVPSLQVEGTTSSTFSQSITANINTSASPVMFFAKSRGTTNGSNDIVSASDTLGVISFNGADGTDIQSTAAQISAAVDGTPGANDMPGRLVFSTTADGAVSSTERMRIDSAGRVGIGSSSLTGYKLKVGTTITGAVTAYGVAMEAVVQSDTTFSASYFSSVASTQATAFTLSNLRHYWTFQNAFGAGSSVTNQVGYFADASLTGATNNYGFYGNIASGTGRFNFYAAGTAANVFAGTTSIGGLVGAESLRVTPVASAVNYFNMQGSTTGNTPQLAVQGSDANIQFSTSSKGTAEVNFFTNSYNQQQFAIIHTASAVNYLQVTGAATGAAPSITATGSDTNIDIRLTPKGTGNVRFGTYTAGILAQAGYITIKDAAGNTRNLLVG